MQLRFIATTNSYKLITKPRTQKLANESNIYFDCQMNGMINLIII